MPLIAIKMTVTWIMSLLWGGAWFMSRSRRTLQRNPAARHVRVDVIAHAREQLIHGLQRIVAADGCFLGLARTTISCAYTCSTDLNKPRWLVFANLAETNFNIRIRVHEFVRRYPGKLSRYS